MDKYNDQTATAAGEFTDGDPLLNIPRTVLRAQWPNMISRELISVVQASGLTLNGAQFDQLLQAIRLIAADSGVPTGTLSFYYGTAAPTGWVELNGALVLRTTYPRLYVHAVSNGIVVLDGSWSSNKGKFSSGNLLNNFRLPDLRGQFLRAWANGSSVDASRTLASLQSSQNLAHTHLWQMNAVGGGHGSGVHQLPIDYDGIIDHASDAIKLTSSSGGTEARPANASAMIIIKA